jgi:hypothetical protein
MGYVLVGIAIVIAGIAYLWLSAFLLLTFGVPVGWTLLIVGVAVGSLLIVLVAGTVLLGRRGVGWMEAPRLIGPVEVQAGRIGGKRRPGLPLRDPAWPSYFVVQPGWDLAAIARSVRTLIVVVWTPCLRWFAMYFRPILVVWPIPVVLFGFLAVLTGVLLAGLALVAAVMVAVTAVAWALGSLTVLLLRLVDLARQWRFRTHASCPRCFAVTSLPAFRCSGCGQLHRDLRAGKLGVLWRRCRCGAVLPTTVWRAAAALTAVCPMCPESDPTELHKGAAEVTDVRIPVFGAASSGKSRLIMAGLVALATLAKRDGQELTFPDERSRLAFADAQAAITGGVRDIPKTQESEHPLPRTLLLRRGRRRALVHLFDAAGERYASRDKNADLAYLDRARALVFVLDPFSIRGVQSHLGSGYASLVQRANAATDEPEDSYNVTAQRLRDFGVATRRQRLAIVVSKADLIRQADVGRALSSDSDAVRGWLVEHGLDNLVELATRDFRAVRYFLVSAFDGDPDGELNAAEPFAWVLGDEGFAIARQPQSSIV